MIDLGQVQRFDFKLKIIFSEENIRTLETTGVIFAKCYPESKCSVDIVLKNGVIKFYIGNTIDIKLE